MKISSLKFILQFLIIFYSLKAFSAIVYDKEDFIITQIDLEKFKDIYFQNYNIYLEDNIAIKEIVFNEKFHKKILISNPEILEITNKEINIQFDQILLKDDIIYKFIFKNKIKNKYVIEYFKKDFKYRDFQKLIYEFEDFYIPFSSDNCMTIENSINMIDNDDYLKFVFESLIKTNSINSTNLIINENKYSTCISNTLISKLENKIFNFINDKIEEKIRKFTYN